MEILKTVTIPVELTDRQALINCVNTSLSSKVVSGNSVTLSPIAVDAVKSVSGTIEDTEMVDGLVFTHNKISHGAGGPSRIVNPKFALIQFSLSAPKTDVE